MLNDKTIGVVIPAYNEESQISMVLDSMPEFVDRIVVINDCSKDKTAQIIQGYIDKLPAAEQSLPSIIGTFVPNKYNYADQLVHEGLITENEKLAPCEIIESEADNSKVVLINLTSNSGVGAAVARGYKWCKDHEIDCVVKIDGDGQMDPGEIESICSPVVYDGIDYVKGNRLIHKSAHMVIPRVRFLGNSILSILTKVASGYWSISDTQTAFTAISREALHSIDLTKIYPTYGYPNDMLVKLNMNFCSIREVGIKPVYSIGEQSKMKIRKLIPRLSFLLMKLFIKRIWGKYLFKSFHPLFLLYHISLALIVVSIPFLVKILILAMKGMEANPVTVLAFVFLFISGFQSLLTAMWMDIQDNDRLQR
ncbi:MAG: glycosyltransferase family 2 protein [Bacteroidetes bacterium]|nr:glycosyltransferase family 2 protein [Bacteroidota bacterium]